MVIHIFVYHFAIIYKILVVFASKRSRDQLLRNYTTYCIEASHEIIAPPLIYY
jgi:hypothetical protein